VCLEEGTQSAWLYEPPKPRVAEVVVAVAPEKKGPQDDQRDAWARANELRTGAIETHVFKAPEHLAGLRNAVRAYRSTTIRPLHELARAAGRTILLTTHFSGGADEARSTSELRIHGVRRT